MKKTLIIVLSLAVVLLTFGVTATASQLFNKKTRITINQPMEIPGTPAIVLAPGTYVLKLLNSSSIRSIVQFFNADETKLYSTVIGIPDYRLQTPEKAEISFYETEPGRAHPIRAWFYPGDNYGVEFVYSKARAFEVAKATNQHVMSAANPTTSTPAEQPTTAQVSQLQNETVAATTPQGTEVSLSEVHPPTTVQAPGEPNDRRKRLVMTGKKIAHWFEYALLWRNVDSTVESSPQTLSVNSKSFLHAKTIMEVNRAMLKTAKAIFLMT